MIGSRVIYALVLCGLSIVPAAAADPPFYRPGYIKAPPAIVEIRAPAPYYVVNHGPEYSGPAIMIVGFRIKDTDLRRSYPFISGYPHYAHVTTMADLYGVLPAALDPAAGLPPHAVFRQKPRRKPVRARY